MWGRGPFDEGTRYWYCRLQRPNGRGHDTSSHRGTRGHERRQLASMARQAKAVLAPQPNEPLTVIADQEYYRGEELLACAKENIVTNVAKSDTSGERGKGEFARSEFRYIAKDDEYECPAEERLI
jgi:hypothetical protein